MLIPASPRSPIREFWAVVITYVADGYVSDADASKIDYAKMLKDMQDGASEANEERKKQGYPAVDIVGWATPPHYDAAGNKIYWARELSFGDAHEHTLELRHPRARPQRLPESQRRRRHEPARDRADADAECARDDRVRPRPALCGLQRLDRQDRRIRHRRARGRRNRRQGRTVRQAAGSAGRAQEGDYRHRRLGAGLRKIFSRDR